MSRPVITIHPEMPIQDALQLMVRERIRRLPVIDRHGILVGIVSERDLLHASPSAATSLNVWELNYLISKITVEQVMTSGVVTAQEDMPIEQVARTLVEKKIGGLPVLRDGRVVGIITETDLLKLLLELLGATIPGLRLTATIPENFEGLNKICGALLELGGTILALATVPGEFPQSRAILLKTMGLSPEILRAAVAPWVDEISNISNPISMME